MRANGIRSIGNFNLNLTCIEGVIRLRNKRVGISDRLNGNAAFAVGLPIVRSWGAVVGEVLADGGGGGVRRAMGVLLYRSSRGLNVLLHRCLRAGNFTAALYPSNRTNFGRFAGGGCSVTMLSIVVPGGSNFALTRRVHRRATSLPVMFLATGALGRSVLRNFGVNTSSCVAGPFSVRRLIFHMRTVLHHMHNGGAGRSAVCRVNGFAFSARGRLLAVNSRRAGLAAGRGRLLTLLYTRTGRVLRHSFTLGAV